LVLFPVLVPSRQHTRCCRSGHQDQAGELVIDPPTLINLGFEWLIEGDDDRNATIEVSYRRTGNVEWR